MSNANAKISFQAVSFGELSLWEQDDHLAAFRAFVRSCRPVIERDCTVSSVPPAWSLAKLNTSGGDGVKAADPDSSTGSEISVGLSMVQSLRAACQAAIRLVDTERSGAQTITKDRARHFFESCFSPHRVVPRQDRCLLTGYYEPVLKGSRQCHGRFQIPLYSRPADLINLVDEQGRAGVGQTHSHARQTAAGLEAFPTRAQIEQGALAGQGLEQFYIGCPVEAFFLHIQGSGLIELDDGTSARLTYDGKNGWPYSSIGKLLIDQGVIGAGEMSLQSLGAYLRSDLVRARQIMQHNKSFVFFRELRGAEAAGAHGVMNVQLTPGRSLAIDPRFHMMGTPIYVCADDLVSGDDKTGFHRLMIGQDVGSAIKGAERGDIYYGSGDSAGELAGVTKARGEFIVLLPRFDLERLADGI